MPMVAQMPTVKQDLLHFAGGWDQLTPSLRLKPGYVTDAQNFECATTGGYRRVAGYERYDGLPSPSAASFSQIQVVSFTNTPSLGGTVTQAVSGATGVVIAVDATNRYFIITKVTGTWDTSNAITEGATAIGTATTIMSSLSALLQAQYTNLAADEYRGDIAAVPGSGAIRGVATLVVGGTFNVYAFRDNSGGTAVDLYKKSGSGWTQVPFDNEISFTAGGASVPTEGDTLTQGGVTATVKRVVTQTGTWGGSTAAGRLIIGTPSGGNFTSGAATITGGINLTLSGAESAITLSPGGKYVFETHNFQGATGAPRLYGADGANRIIEFDGTTLVPITTGLSPDTPKYVHIFKNHLFYSISTEALFSAPGDPYRHTAADNAGEITTGDTITGFMEQPGAETVGALAILGRNDVGMLYGTGLADFEYSSFKNRTGAFDYSVQELDRTYFLDDRGIYDLDTSLNFGNFVQSSLTEQIQDFITSKRTRVTQSTVNRERGQYRLYFNDGFALFVTLVNGKVIGRMPMFFANTFNVVWNGEDASGNEVTFAGDDTNGMVYQLDVGSSFDGADIEAFVTLNWNPSGNSRIRKRYRHASLELQSDFYANLQFGYQLDYGTSEIEQQSPVNYESNFLGGPAWDSFTWDDFVWDGQTLSPTEMDVTGTGINIGITISSSTDYILPYTLNSLILDYTPRRRQR